jgi:hypothetical protein
MRLQNVPLDQIVANPWRDLDLFPIDPEHVQELRESINEHDFFSSLKGRRVNGKVEIGCGHARVEAARKAKLETIPIFIDNMDEDEMVLLMTDENATQPGANPGAVMNEVAAVTRRLIDGLLDGTIVPPRVAAAFEGKKMLDEARGRLRKSSNVHMALSHNVIRRYLGRGNPDRSHRGERQIREAVSALKQSGTYDDIVEQATHQHPPPVDETKPAKGKAVAETEPKKPQRRLLDEKTAHLFPNEHQFQAFREAVTTPAAQQVIPVEDQRKLAQRIMNIKNSGDFKKKQVGAPTIKAVVHQEIKDRMAAQRELDREEKERYLAEQREAEIDDVLHNAKASLRSLSSMLVKLMDLADQFPHHPKIGGFSAKLDDLIGTIKQLSAKLK